jgi:hypothetical protein
MRKRIITTFAALLLLAVVLPAQADYSSTVLSFNPVAYYRLNETAPVPLGDVATNSGTLGAVAQGLYLDGATHPVFGGLPGVGADTAANIPNTDHSWGTMRVRVPYHAVLNQNAPFTAEFWARPDQAAVTTCPYASVDFKQATRYGWLFYQNLTTPQWSFRVVKVGGNTTITGGTVTAYDWQHVVGVYDGANVSLYVNGALVAGPTAVGAAYTPVTNPTVPLSIGGRGDGDAGTFGYSGDLDEVVFYTNVLTGGQILAHYQAGINSATPDYSAVVLAHHPPGYWRLGEPYYTAPDPATLPVAVNSGSLGTDATGASYPGVTAGVAGPSYSGFGANNYACQLDGFTGHIGLGYPEGLNFAGEITLMAWIKPTAITTVPNALHNLLAHGYTQTIANQEISFRINNTEYEVGSWESGGTITTTAPAAQDLGQWIFMAATYDGAKWNLYRYGELIASATLAGGSAVFQDTTTPWSIGSRGDPSTDGRFFWGAMDEVAIFSRGLSQNEIRQVLHAANLPPIIIQQPQAPPGTIIAGMPVTLTTVVAGTPTLAYQWTKEGTNLLGQTTTSLFFANITTNDTGNYAVVVTNAYGSVTSSVVALSITYPAAPAALVNAAAIPVYNSATHSATLTHLTLEFTGPLGASGGNPANYTIPGLTVSGARFTNANMTVLLTTSPQTQGALYTVTVTGVTDGVGQPLANNQASFRAWVQSPVNGVRFELYPSEDTATPAFATEAVGALTNNSFYPDSPLMATNLWAFDSRIIFPDDNENRYGARMRGIFVPPVSGNWRFYLRSDDASQLFLNPNGPDSAGRLLILQEPGCCGDWNKYASDVYPLVVGQSYYIEMLYKEGGGGDYGKVAALLEPVATVTNYPPIGVANLEIDPASLAGPAIAYPYAPADVGGALTLVGPASVSVQANHAATFTVAAANPGGWPMSYQWRRNASPISGETRSSYTLVPTTADTGARFSVQVAKLGSVVVSSDAVLTVTADTDVPAVQLVRGSTALNTVTVRFNELMATPATSSFSIAGYSTVNAVLDANGTDIILTFDRALAPGQSYDLKIQNVTDATGTLLPSATNAFRSFVFSRGLLKFEYFPGLSESDNVLDSTLLVDPKFPKEPWWTAFLTAFETRTVFPDNSHTRYGALITGLFVPPASGDYLFYIKSDDSSRLFLNATGADPIGIPFTVPPLLEETGCCGAFSDLESLPQTLTAGQIYALAAVYKEGNGGDYMETAVKLSTDPAPANSLTPIPGYMLGVLEDPAGASVTITQQPVSVVGVYRGVESPQDLLNVNFNANNGGFTEIRYGTANSEFAPWAYDATRGTWSCSGSNACFGPVGSGLTAPAITLTRSGGVALSFAHRYSFEGYNPSDGTPWDGGQVRLSVNGGPFATVPAANFLANGYLAPIAGSINAALTSEPGWINAAWVGESPDYSLGTYVVSEATLGYFNAGDTLRVQFATSWDDCSEGTEPNWEIDRVQVSIGAAVPVVASFTVGAESTYRDLPNPYMAYIWQQDTGTGFQDIVGAGSPTLTVNAFLDDSGTRYRCIVYSPGASATSEVATLTITLELSATRTAADTLTLSWPLPDPLPNTSFLLERSATMLTGSWVTVPTGQYQIGASRISVPVSISATGPTQFYRLRRN